MTARQLSELTAGAWQMPDPADPTRCISRATRLLDRRTIAELSDTQSQAMSRQDLISLIGASGHP